MTLSLEDIFDATAKVACTAFETTGEVAPMWAGHTAAGEVFFIVPEHFANERDKDNVMREVRVLFKEKGAVAFAFMTEAWMLSTQGSSIAAVARHVRTGGSLEHHPDRIEVVHIQAEDKERCLVAHFQILRPERGKATLAPMVKHNDDVRASKGRMVGLLKD